MFVESKIWIKVLSYAQTCVPITCAHLFLHRVWLTGKWGRSRINTGQRFLWGECQIVSTYRMVVRPDSQAQRPLKSLLLPRCVLPWRKPCLQSLILNWISVHHLLVNRTLGVSPSVLISSNNNNSKNKWSLTTKTTLIHQPQPLWIYSLFLWTSTNSIKYNYHFLIFIISYQNIHHLFNTCLFFLVSPRIMLINIQELKASS